MRQSARYAEGEQKVNAHRILDAIRKLVGDAIGKPARQQRARSLGTRCVSEKSLSAQGVVVRGAKVSKGAVRI